MKWLNFPSWSKSIWIHCSANHKTIDFRFGHALTLFSAFPISFPFTLWLSFCQVNLHAFSWDTLGDSFRSLLGADSDRMLTEEHMSRRDPLRNTLWFQLQPHCEREFITREILSTSLLLFKKNMYMCFNVLVPEKSNFISVINEKKNKVKINNQKTWNRFRVAPKRAHLIFRFISIFILCAGGLQPGILWFPLRQSGSQVAAWNVVGSRSTWGCQVVTKSPESQ